MISVRRFDPDLSDLPRAWYGGDLALTHVVNGLNLVFPDGERFFIRSVRHYEKRIDDPELRASIKGFYGQEAQHGFSHEQLNAALEAQGFELDSWLKWYRHVAYKRIEPATPPLLRLACTAALEHFTAEFARHALQERFLDAAHPGVRDLLFWHAAEEIEHKSVAYDVYCAVGGGYVVRMLGLVLATLTFLLFWRSAARHLFAQEEGLGRKDVKASVRRAKEKGQDRSAIVKGAILSYIKPGFHPDEVEDTPLARGYLTSVGMV